MSQGGYFPPLTLYRRHDHLLHPFSWQQMLVMGCVVALICLLYVSDDPHSLHVGYHDMCFDSYSLFLLEVCHVFLSCERASGLIKTHVSSICRRILMMVPTNVPYMC